MHSNQLRVEPKLSRDELQSSALARFFSATVLKELASRGVSPTFARLVRESGVSIDPTSDAPISTTFEHAFDLLKRKANRHEYIYKAALTEKILLGVHSLHTASMLTEFRVGACKADVVILNGTGTVYEIKSERDTLSRLRDQVEAYSKVFAKVNIIVGDNHLGAAKASVPNYVGIMILTDRYQVSTVREPIEDPSRTSASAIFDAISQREAEIILKMAERNIPEVPNTQRYRALKDLFMTLDAEFAHRSMVTVLKRTRNLEPLSGLLTSVPDSLHTVTIASKLRRQDQTRLAAVLKTPLREALNWG